MFRMAQSDYVLVGGGHTLWEDIFDQLSDLDPVDLAAGKVSLKGAPELHNLILSEPCVLEVDL